MFLIEELHSQVIDKLVSHGISELVSIIPLDNIRICGLPESWDIKRTCMPKLYANRAKEFASFEARKDDIWIVTYPKCGTTWTQEMVWMLMNDMNFEKTNAIDIAERTLFFELNGMVEIESFDTIKALKEQKSPRVIKTHLPINLLPRDIWNKKCKIIYVTRDPKDVVVSFFHHFVSMTPFTGTMEEFAEGFIADQFIYCSFWHHVLEFWMIRQQENILFINFEDMKKDLRMIIDKTSFFLGKHFEEEKINQLMDHLSFEKMRANPTCNNQGLVKCLYGILNKEYKVDTAFKFMRKGEIGGYKTELPLKYIHEINLKSKEIFQPYGLNLYCIEDK